MAVEIVTLEFAGKIADEGILDLYDASISNYGLARTLSILGHYYQSGQIIAHAPRSEVQIYIYPPEAGSFKQVVGAAVLGTVLAVPFQIYIQRVIEDWVPDPDPQMTQVIELLKEQNRILRLQRDLPAEPDDAEKLYQERMTETLNENEEEFQVLRSITANSFKDIFRPIGRSADYVRMTAGPTGEPIAAIDMTAVIQIESERRDPERREIVGIVNSFSRPSKTGIVFSNDLKRGIRFIDVREGRLPPQDIYSWSQYMREPIRMFGHFVYWFDGRIKSFLVEDAAKLPERL